MMEVLLCTIFGAFILLSYTMGLQNGQKIAKKEEINVVPKVETNRYLEEEEFDQEQEKLMKVLANVEAYDGTSTNQEKVGGE